MSILTFKDGYAAFETICRLCNNEIICEKPMLGLVDAPSGIEASFINKSRGTQNSFIRIANNERQIYTLAGCTAQGGPKLNKGDLVIWIPIEKVKDLPLGDAHIQEMGRELNMGSFCEWFGFIIAKVSPEYNNENGTWKTEYKWE